MLLINGVTGQIGSSLLEIAVKKGMVVAGIGRNPTKIDRLSKKYPNCFFSSISDLGSETESEGILNEILENSGQQVVSYLHAAATLSRTSSPIDTSIENFKEAIYFNLTAAFVWNKLVISRMISTKTNGAVLNIASQASRTGGFGSNTSYAASKGGLITLTKSFARHAAQFNIRVNAISPGFIDNEMMVSNLSDDQIRFFSDKTALKRLGTNEEVAQVCDFLLGPNSSYITGENIEVSAGQILG
jgi:3-oxoacyl-[acyl-carrier protein] reductase